MASISAVVLFALMFFHWFGVEATGNPNLLIYIQSVLPGKNVWEALEYIPIVLLIAILVTLAVAVLRMTNAVPTPPIPVNASVAMLGLVSAVLIVFRIVEPPPPVFLVEPTVTLEGTVQPPIILALLAAAGIAFGGYLAMREEGFSFSDLRERRDRDRGARRASSSIG